MILINSNKLIDKLLNHKRFYTRAYRCYSEMPLDVKARCDEIDNCIAEITNLQYLQYKEGELRDVH